MTDYPGVAEGKDLWTLLEGLRVVKLDDDGRGVRQLVLDEGVANWAQGTRMLELAMRLWELRERTLLAMVRELRARHHYSADQVVEVGSSLSRDGTIVIDGYPELLDRSGSTKQLGAWLLEQLPELRAEYEELFDGLSELGLALLQEDRNTVRSFFR